MLELGFSRAENILMEIADAVSLHAVFSANVFLLRIVQNSSANPLLFIWWHLELKNWCSLVQSLTQPISFLGLMIVILSELIPPFRLTKVSTMVMLKSSQWLGKNV